jgi:serine/threonine-protein kinase
MSGDDNKPQDDGPDRTVFMPPCAGFGSGSQPPVSPVTPGDSGAGAGAEPMPGVSQVPVQPVSQPPGQPPLQPSSRPSAIVEGRVAPGGGGGIQIGDVLNHIFEVKRFIARGGMGEVFEGINVNSDERVAIKVMLPSLAADANVLAMFRKEARTLTRLSHPALVQYRVLAQEPQLGVFYIVTEYVDGANLSDVITELNASPQDLRKLLKRLAEGLHAAHQLGAIHRDISPDNVMLEEGKLTGAKIIDFGIAKDLNAGAATIIGDGFAGKLNYVAPEQLGDFNRSVGPWTDVYSLGLLILAVAMRKDVDMGGTLVNAVDKRRAGPDISGAPEELRPLLSLMLRPDPAQRPQSMGEVLDLLRNPPKLEAPAPPQVAQPAEPPVPAFVEPLAAPPPTPAPPPPPPPSPDPIVKEEARPVPATQGEAEPSRGLKPAVIAAGAGAVALLAFAGWYFGIRDSSGSASAERTVAAAGSGDAAGALASARAAIDAGLPGIACTWLDLADISTGPPGLQLAFQGVAGNPADAQARIARILSDRKLQVAALDFQDVSPIDAAACEPMNALQQIRDRSGGRMSLSQRKFEMARTDSGDVAARAVVDFKLADPAVEVSLFGVEPSGKISQIAAEKAELVAGSDDLGDSRYRLMLDVDHTGWSGLLLLSGQKPFDAEMIAAAAAARGADWTQRFQSAAKERNWKAEMVWFETVDEQPN